MLSTIRIISVSLLLRGELPIIDVVLHGIANVANQIILERIAKEIMDVQQKPIVPLASALLEQFRGVLDVMLVKSRHGPEIETNAGHQNI